MPQGPMSQSPMSASPFEVLRVAASASQDELRKAYRRALRETHPDTGGDPQRFHAVQYAWEQISTPARRAAYKGGAQAAGHGTFTAQGGRAQQDTRPKARSYGYPGGWRREQYLAQLREWAGRGAEIKDPYDPVFVRNAPREIRHTLADALAEEATARTLSSLGIGFTIWHDVATGVPKEKLDHVVLGPTGLFALMSEDFGGAVTARKGDLAGEAVAGDRPMHVLGQRSKAVARALRVKFGALAIVLPDAAMEGSTLPLGTARGTVALAVTQSALPSLLRSGIPGAPAIGGNQLFDLRTRIQTRVRFV